MRLAQLTNSCTYRVHGRLHLSSSKSYQLSTTDSGIIVGWQEAGLIDSWLCIQRKSLLIAYQLCVRWSLIVEPDSYRVLEAHTVVGHEKIILTPMRRALSELYLSLPAAIRRTEKVSVFVVAKSPFLSFFFAVSIYLTNKNYACNAKRPSHTWTD